MMHERRPGGSERYGEHQHDDSGLPYRLGVLGERVPAPAPWPPTGQIIEVTLPGALPRHDVAQPPAAHSAVHAAAPGLCTAGLAQRHDQRPASTRMVVTLRSEQNVKILSHLLTQLAK